MNVTQKKESVPSHLPRLALPSHSLSLSALCQSESICSTFDLNQRGSERGREGDRQVPCEVCDRLAVGNESDVQSFVVIRVGVLVTHFLFVICECRIQRVVED
jgi:hypothetical protein